jgi:archaemetzincin
MKKDSLTTIPSLGLIEMGRVGEVAVRVVAANLQTVLGIAVDILEPQDVPASAFQEHRQQYDAGLVLKHLLNYLLNHPLHHLARMPDDRHLRILALTEVDLCIPILTYVFGEAEVGGKVAVVSSFRLRHNDDGTTVSLDKYYERLAKVALHEVAHTLSALHCDEPGCLMRFSAKVRHLDEIGIFFCDRCEFVVQQGVRLQARG